MHTAIRTDTWNNDAQAPVPPRWRSRVLRVGSLARRVDWQVLALALAITLAQVLLATMSGHGDSWSIRYRSLCTFDGGWYEDIIDHGYRSTSPPGAGAQYNAAFFPGYPVAAGWVSRLLGLSTGIALLVTAQLATVVLWCAVLRMLKRWKVEPSVSFAAVILIFCQPGGFYFVVSYSESLFIASLVLLLALGPRVNCSLPMFVGAVAAGYVMAATRIIGAPLAALPALFAWRELRALVRWPLSVAPAVAVLWRHFVVAIVTALGTLSFFFFCAWRFGHWNEYMRAREIGWFGTQADYGALFLLQRFRLFVPQFSDGFVAHADLTTLYVPVLSLLLILLVVADSALSKWGAIRAFSERVPFYVAAGLLFFLSSTNANPQIISTPGFIRYGLYSFTLLVLALAHAHRHSTKGGRSLPLGVQVAVFLLGAVSLTLQLQLCWQFARSVFLS